MLKSGDIVVQDYTMINNINYKDNKEKRLSVVLFETVIDGERFVCTSPLTNNTKAALKNNYGYYYFPYLIFEARKYSCVKINSTNIYPSNIIHFTGISLDECHMDRIFNKIMNYSEPKEREELYKMVRENIINLGQVRKSLIEEEKANSKRLRRERRRNAKRGINMV